ncbi:hypothetical protein [Paenibacillus glycanilyticus]|uniref:Uncharacterized protein n=1 Tax=Paenibacillus glycanilyticus TaxID=126569 RepID=A0ABQ6GIA4_9BACL|nr:hypothetical protein [Paenibacillus glycanilyticus]GLX70674.1 hypothetical protein MU1_50200 [Paenibacillus glycanilyticus]
MNYLVPMCDCGKKLIVFEQIVHFNEYNILRNGKPEKKPTFVFKEGHLNTTRLKCEDEGCDNEYSFDEDEEGRIVRKEKIDEAQNAE